MPPHDEGGISVVLDLTSGSGSLSLACTQASYSSIAYEKDLRQFNLACRHLNANLASAGTRATIAPPEEDMQEVLQLSLVTSNKNGSGDSDSGSASGSDSDSGSGSGSGSSEVEVEEEAEEESDSSN